MAEFKPNFTSIDFFVNNSFLGKSVRPGFEGFLKPSRYGVRFVLPARNDVWAEAPAQIADFLTNNVISIQVPGFNMTEAEVGLRHRMGKRNIGNISIRFYEDQMLSVKNWIGLWIDKAIRHRSDIDNFAREYLDDIKGEIEVIPILLNGDTSPRKDVFKDVFPISTGNVQYDYGDEGVIGKINVTFKYRYHTIEENFIE